MREHEEIGKEPNKEESQMELPEGTTPIVDNDDPDYSEAQLKEARENGYNPDDPKGLSPGEFNRRGPLFQHIKTLKQQHTREMNELKKQLNEIKGQFTQSEKRGYERALKELEQKRMQAVELGDKSTFVELDKEYQNISKAIANGDSKPPVPQLTPEALEFQERNAHWLNDPSPEGRAMYKDAEEAVNMANTLRFREGKDPMTQHQEAKYIEEYVQKRYPHRFENPAKTKPPMVEKSGGARLATGGSKMTLDKLPTQALRDSCKQLMATVPDFTVEKFVEICKKQRIIVE